MLTPPSNRSTSFRIAERILEAIPCDRWVSAAEISAMVGVSPHVVGALIGFRLLGAYVECKPRRPSERKYHLYRRLRRVDASEKTLYS